MLMTRASWQTLTHKLVDLGDPVLFGWSWNWEWHALTHAPLDLFNGNIFSPNDLTIAYTDNMLVLLVPFKVLGALGAGWALQINLLIIGLLTGSLLATAALTRRFTERVDTAVFAAVSFTFGSFAFAHQGHLQLMLLGQFPLAFLLAFRFLERRRTVDAVAFGLVNASFFLGSLYYAATWMVCVAVVIVGYLAACRFRPGPRFWTGLAVVALASATAVPFVLPYLQLSQERALVPEWGLKPQDLVTVPFESILYPSLDERVGSRLARGEHSFFPGFSAGLFAIVGLGVLVSGTLTARKRQLADDDAPERAEPDDRRRLELWLLAAAGGAAMLLAVGPEVRGVSMPFRWFHDFVPGFSGIRVAARLAVPGLLAIAVLAAVGLTAGIRRIPPRVATAVVTVLVAFLLLELAAPQHRIPLPADNATLAVYRELDRRPPGVVLELPMADPIDARQWAGLEAPRMLYGTLDFHPRLNGYSGSWPDDYLATVATMNQFPAPDALIAARLAGVRYVVLHTGPFAGFEQLSPATARAIVAELGPSVRADRHGPDWLVDLGPVPERRSGRGE